MFILQNGIGEVEKIVVDGRVYNRSSVVKYHQRVERLAEEITVGNVAASAQWCHVGNNYCLIENPFDVCRLFEDESPGDCVWQGRVLFVNHNVRVLQHFLKRYRSDFHNLQLFISASDEVLWVSDVENRDLQQYFRLGILPPKVRRVPRQHRQSLSHCNVEQCKFCCDHSKGHKHKSEQQQTPNGTCNLIETWCHFLNHNRAPNKYFPCFLKGSHDPPIRQT